jgi:hypothetical protein
VKDWRSSIRRLVNRDEDLSLWRRVVIRVVDPAESYMRRMEDRPARQRREGRAGWTRYGRTGTPQLKTPEIRTYDEHAEGHAARLDRLAPLLREFGPYFEAKARAVMAGSTAQLRTTGGTITTRLVRFRHGDSVLEWDTASSSWTGHGSMRLGEHHADTLHVIVEQLALRVLGFGSDAEPIPD